MEQQKKVDRLFSEYLNDPANFAYTPQALFGDVKLDAFFLKPGTTDIEGVIDPEPMIGDSYVDFSRLEYEIPPADFEQLLQEYGHPDPEGCKRKIRFAQLCRFARKTLFFWQNADEPNAEKMLELLRQRLETTE